MVIGKIGKHRYEDANGISLLECFVLGCSRLSRERGKCHQKNHYKPHRVRNNECFPGFFSDKRTSSRVKRCLGSRIDPMVVGGEDIGVTLALDIKHKPNGDLQRRFLFD